jgi:glycosyltransferase involved in cell wall biosynthesis
MHILKDITFEDLINRNLNDKHILMIEYINEKGKKSKRCFKRNDTIYLDNIKELIKSRVGYDHAWKDVGKIINKKLKTNHTNKKLKTNHTFYDKCLQCCLVIDEYTELEYIEEITDLFKKFYKENIFLSLKIIDNMTFTNKKISKIINSNENNINYCQETHKIKVYNLLKNNIVIYSENSIITNVNSFFHITVKDLLNPNKVILDYIGYYLLIYKNKGITIKNETFVLNNKINNPTRVSFLIEMWKKNIKDTISQFNIPKDKSIILYCKQKTKATSVGGYIERGHQLMNSFNKKSKDLFYVCIDSFWNNYYTKKADNITLIDNVIYLTLPKIKEIQNSYTRYSLDIHNFLIKLLNIKIIHSCSFYKHSLLSLLCAKNNNLPHFYEVRGRIDLTNYEKMNNLNKKLYSNMESIVENNSDHIFYITEQCKSYVEKTDSVSKPGSILPNSSDYDESIENVDLNRVPNPSKIFKNGNIKFVIGYFGSTYEYENFDLIISTLKKLIQENNEIGFIYAGNCVNNVKEKLNILHQQFPKNIIIHDYLSQQKLNSIYYPNLNLTFIPRKDIAVSNVIAPIKPFSLLLKKIPLIVSNVECLKDISENGKNCEIFDIKNEKEAFYNKILDIYKNGYPISKINSGFEYAKNNSWNKTVKSREDLYIKFT